MIWAQIRKGKIRLIVEGENPPYPGDWVDISNIIPQPKVGDLYDESSQTFSEPIPVTEPDITIVEQLNTEQKQTLVNFIKEMLKK